MKSTGIIRKLDKLGRIVLPKELRTLLQLKENETPIEIFVEGNNIVLGKYETHCVFCGEARDNITYKCKNICKACYKEIQE